MPRYDTTQLIADVIRDAKLPAGSSYRTVDTLLSIASDELEQSVVPELLKVSGGHLMAYEDTALVGERTRYRFPARAIRPERLQIVNEDGLLLGKLHLASGDMVDEVLAGRCLPGDALGYWTHENNHAVLVLQRSCSTTGRYLRTYYRRQPNRLVEVGGEQAGRITEVAEGLTSNTYTVLFSSEANALAFRAATAGLGGTGLVDVIKRLPPFESIADDVTPDGGGLGPSAPSAYVVLPISGLQEHELPEAGDVIAAAGYSPYVQLPVAFYGILVAYTVARILKPTDRAGAQAALDEATRKLETALTTITPRSDEAETTVNDVWGA